MQEQSLRNVKFRDDHERTASHRGSLQRQHRRSCLTLIPVFARWYCACAGSHTNPSKFERTDQLPRITTKEKERYKNEEIMPSKMIVDAPQALADRRSTNITDLVELQPQCLQGGILPVRVHILHTVRS